MGKKVLGAVLVVVGIVMMVQGYNQEGSVFQYGLQLLAAGISITAAAALGATPNPNRRAIKYNPKSNVEPRKIIYGNTIASGPLVYVETLTDDKVNVRDYLSRIVVLAGHPIEAITGIYLDEHLLNTKSADDDSSFTRQSDENDSFFKNKILTLIGITQNETNAPDSTLAIAARKFAGPIWSLGSEGSGGNINYKITDAQAAACQRKLNDCPYIFTRIKFVEDGWTKPPVIRAVVKGKRVRDANAVRDAYNLYSSSLSENAKWDLILADSTLDPVYRNNAADCILDYLMDVKLGLGIPLSEIDLTYFGDASLACEESMWDVAINGEELVLPGTNTVANDMSTINSKYNFEIPALRNGTLKIRIHTAVEITFPDGKTIATNTALDGPRIHDEIGPTSFFLKSGGTNPVGASNIGTCIIDMHTGEILIEIKNGYSGTLGANMTIDYVTGTDTKKLRYSCNGTVYLDSSPVQIVEELLTSCAGSLVYTQGKYRLFVGEWEVPQTVALTEEDLAGPLEITTSAPRSERFSAIKGVYSNKDKEWELEDFPEVFNNTYRDADAGSDYYPESVSRQGYSYRDLELPFTTDVDTATRISKIILDTARQALRVKVLCKPTALRYSVGDNIYLNLPSLGSGVETRADFVEATFGAVVANISNVITSIPITDGGFGYLYPPEITVTDGTGLVVVPIIESGSLIELKILSGGTGYINGLSTVTVKNPLPSWNNKTFKVEKWSTTGEGLIEMSLKEDIAILYAQNSEVFTTDPAPDLSDNTSVESLLPSDLKLSTGINLSETRDGTYNANIQASWTPVTNNRMLSHYEVEIGNGTKWRKKIKSINVEAARLDAPISRIPTIAATATYKWRPETIINPGNPLLSNIEYRTPARLEVNVTSGGSGYIVNENEQGDARYYLDVELSDAGSSSTAVIRFIIDSATGKLKTGAAEVLSMTGDFVTTVATSIPNATMLAPVENEYMSKVNVTLWNDIAAYPGYKELSTRAGPYSSYIFDTTILKSHTRGYLDFTNDVGSPTLESTFDAGFNNLTKCVSLGIGDSISSIFPVREKVDFTSAGRDFSLEWVISPQPATSSNKVMFTLGDETTTDMGPVQLNMDFNASSQISSINIISYGTGAATVGDLLYTLPTPGNIPNAAALHMVYTERGSQAAGGSLKELYVNGTLVKRSTVDVLHSFANAPSEFTFGRVSTSTITGDSSVQVAVFNVYDKKLINRTIVEMFNELAEPTHPKLGVLSNIKAFTITDIDQGEFNGYKSIPESAAVLTSTTATYDIRKIDQLSSFVPEAATGLPGAHVGTFGARVSVVGATASAMYEIDTLIRTNYSEAFAPNPPPLSLNTCMFKTAIPDLTTIVPGTIVRVSGVYDPYRLAPFSGEQMVSSVITSGGTTTGITWKSALVYPSEWQTDSLPPNSVAALLDKDEAYLHLEYPTEFTNRKTVSPREDAKTTFKEGIINTKEYLVRLRSVDTRGNASSWVTASIMADSDLKAPNPIYTTTADNVSSITVILDFSKDISGASDSVFHTETNLSHAELIVVKKGTNRYDASNDPGTADQKTRWVTNIPVNTNAKTITDGLVEYTLALNGESVDYYVWTRLVTMSGITSAWFTNDSGLGDGTEGLGPVRGDAASYTNLVGNDNSETTTTTITTTTTTNEGSPDPAPDTTITPGTDQGEFEIYKPGGGIGTKWEPGG